MEYSERQTLLSLLFRSKHRMDILEKLEGLAVRYNEVSEQIVLPDVISDQKRYRVLMKEYKDLGKIVETYEAYKICLSNIQGSKEVLDTEKDEEFREMAKMELEENSVLKEQLDEEIKVLLIPKDPDDDKNALLEIRAGAGGDESALFAGDLLRMYMRYAESQNWKIAVDTAVEGTAGGYSKISATVSGEEVYGKLKFESGVHRVQRVPATESQGRVHTSAASVAVLPEIDDIDFDLNMKDVRKDTYRASGAGGQHVNKTESAVRLTHLPTGIVAECQDGRSQHKNFDTALTALRSKLYEIELRKQEDEVGAHRKSLIGSGDRSDKIRTYNYPQSRVTDHRINKTVYNLDAVVGGDIQDFIESLRMADNAEKMKEGND